MINKEKEWSSMEEAIQIEEILTEANAHNLRNEVKTTADMFIKDDNLLCPIAAHNMALLQWVEI
tara:strand:- start:1601 stop:1792 length:192 start_codon:yes stop_codon:yes gene_type:complete